MPKKELPKRDRYGHFLPPMIYMGLHVPAEVHRKVKAKASLEGFTIEQTAAALLELYVSGEVSIEKEG